MANIDQLCARCGEQGVQAILKELASPEDLDAVAQGCFAHAKDARQSGDEARAERLFEAAQYLHYLALPYD